MSERILIALFLIVLTLTCTPSSAQQATPNSGAIEDIVKNSGWKKRDQPLTAEISGALSERLDGINTLIDESEYQEALTELEETSRRRLADYEEAVILQMLGYVHGLAGNTDLAIEHWEKTLATEQLTPFQHQGVLFSLAHQYAAKQDFEKAIELMTEWFLYEERA